MKLNKGHFIGASFGIIIIILSIIFLRGQKIFYFALVLGSVLITIPFLISLILERGKQKEVEAKFLEFMRDLVENVRSGTPISKSIINLQKRDYGSLTVHIQKLANQIYSGIPLTIAFTNFAKDTGSKVISRAVSLVSEAEKAGGKITDILESVANSINQIEQLKKERKSAVSNLIVQGYIIFLVFLLIMIALQFMILPLASNITDISDFSIKSQTIDQNESFTPMLVLILIQSFFTGLVIGKISEGSFKDGIKHSFILTVMTLIISTGAYAFWDKFIH